MKFSLILPFQIKARPMSPPATSPYKSQLFNFLNRQSLRWRDRLGTVVRHLKVAAEWGTQILLYPAYLVVQAGRMAGRQLGQATVPAKLLDTPPQAEPPSPTPRADQPLQQVLEGISSWLPVVATDNSEIPLRSQKSELENQEYLNLKTAPFPPSPPLSSSSPLLKTKVQGIASLLGTRRLVLVDVGNQVLDILSNQQQEKLRQRISLEIANYCHEYRLVQTQGRKYPGLIPNFRKNQVNVLPAARFFWRVMRWVQTGPVAIAANLFGESHLVPPPPHPLSPSPPPPPILPQGNRQLAGLETKLSTGLKSLIHWSGQRFQGPIGLSFKPLTSFFSQETATTSNFNIAKIHEGVLTDVNSTSELPIDKVGGDPFEIQVLIQAAIDYFFGTKKGTGHFAGRDSSNSSTAPSLQGNSSRENVPLCGKSPFALSVGESQPPVEDPWLFWDDLFTKNSGQELIEAEFLENSSPPPLLADGLPIPSQRGTSVGEYIQQDLQQQGQSKSKSLRVSPISPKNLVKGQVSVGTVISQTDTNTKLGSQILSDGTDPQLGSKRRKGKIIMIDKNRYRKPDAITSQPTAADESLETAFDWLEAEVKPVGYIKHPLEMVLEWLDRLILWLEEWATRIWRWLQ